MNIRPGSEGKAIVLLSGGQDSTTSLYWARSVGYEVIALSLGYGQRHAFEREAAREIARMAGAPHIELDFPAFATIGGSALTDATKPIQASGGYADKGAPGGLPTSFVPGRNAFFLSVAASVAVVHGAKTIVTGVCETDYSGYPDCREEFVVAMGRALTHAMPSSAGPIRIATPLMRLSKKETVELAREVGAWEALSRSVTCYLGRRPGCGTCPACELRAAGFEAAGEIDPAIIEASLP